MVFCCTELRIGGSLFITDERYDNRSFRDGCWPMFHPVKYGIVISFYYPRYYLERTIAELNCWSM